MHIEFAADEAGFREACALYRIVRQAQHLDPADSAEVQLLDALRAASEAHFNRPEFAALRSAAAGDEDVPPSAVEGGWWRALFGPSRREIMLSKQRIAALERVARAEHAAFEALAETARVARERDAALARLRALGIDADGTAARPPDGEAAAQAGEGGA